MRCFTFIDDEALGRGNIPSGSPILFNVENEAFEVFAFGMVDIDGVVNGLSELVQDAHLTP